MPGQLRRYLTFFIKMRLLVFSAVILAISQVTIQGQGFQYGDKRDFAVGSDKGEVSIKLDDPILERGESYSVEYTFHVTNSSYDVYNWQFISLIPLPGQLAIYDANKKYIGDLIAFTQGSRRGVSDDDWIFLYGGTRVGRVLGFRAGSVPMTAYNSEGNWLPTGEYYIQLILYKAFLSPNPYRLLGEKIDFYKTFDRAELCRSNVLKVQLVN